MIKLILSFLITCYAVSTFAQLRIGKYCDTNGIWHEGFMRHQIMELNSGCSNQIEFKESRKVSSTLLTCDKITAFVIELDSFAIVRNFYVDGMFVSRDFAKVLETGEINLFLHKALVPDRFGGAIRYTYVLSDSNRVQTLTDRNLGDQLSTWIGSNVDLSKKVSLGYYALKDIQYIIHKYNTDRRKVLN